MKSSSPLSAVMLTTVFFLCSAVFFTNVHPQDLPNDETKANVSGTPLSTVTGSPSSNGSQSTTNSTLDEHLQEENKGKSRQPDPMFRAMFPQGDGPRELLDKKIKDYSDKVGHVQAYSLINDAATAKSSESVETGPTGKTVSLITGSSGSTKHPSVVTSDPTAAVKQPRPLGLRYTFLSASGVLLFLICMLLCYEQCCQSPHY
uniref:Candidate secreted effector n=1 Tax=Meloidogyne incognita TaxID=6306 RepID=A0A914LQA0_MELIC